MARRSPSALVASVACVVVSAGLAHAATITVTTTRDVSDAAGPSLAQLPGPDGVVSFREAVAAANANPGPDTIAFAIPTSEWWFIPEMAVLRLEAAPFLVDDDETTLDFTTQTAFTGDTNPNGAEVGLYAFDPNGLGSPAIIIRGDRCIVRGLGNVWQRGYALELQGNDNRVVGCVIDGPVHSAIVIEGPFGGPPATGNVIGGTAPGEGNRLAGGGGGVRIVAPADNNLVVGNVIDGGATGILVAGSQFSSPPVGNRIGGPTEAERNVVIGVGRFCCEGEPTGSYVSVSYAQDTIVEGNFLGVTPDGPSGMVQRAPRGVLVADSLGTVVRDNVIADILVEGINHHAGDFFGVGVEVRAASSDTLLTGNVIGADATGNPLPNLQGVTVTAFPASARPTDTRIEENLIAFNERVGVEAVWYGATGVTITRNSIHSNGGLGIDRGEPGVEANDPGDTDGATNTPTLTSVAGDSGEGTLDSAPNETFRVEVFGNDTCDPSGFGEGMTFLGADDVTTDGAGQASFVITLDTPATAGSFVTATATRLSTGDTSEFSACVEAGASASSCPGDTNGDHAVGFTDLNAVLADFGRSGGSVGGDCNGDGAVDFADLNVVLSNFGVSCG